MVAIINRKKTTIGAINAGLVESPHRPYLGMSMLGHPCERYLWYTFRWAYPSFFSPRVNRLFNRGHREEQIIIDTLESVGVHTYGFQEEMVDVHGHCKGHNDGRCIGVLEAPKTEHLAEFKTSSDKYFKEIKSKGVKASKFVHYAQMQLYMHKLALTRALYVVVNKNDDDMYIERVYYDSGIAIKLLRRAEGIVLSDAPPKKRFKPTWYECKWCNARPICHGNEKVEINCRTCKSGDLLPGGCWECSNYGLGLATQQQRLGCAQHETMDCFIKEGE